MLQRETVGLGLENKSLFTPQVGSAGGGSSVYRIYVAYVGVR